MVIFLSFSLWPSISWDVYVMSRVNIFLKSICTSRCQRSWKKCWKECTIKSWAWYRPSFLCFRQCWPGLLHVSSLKSLPLHSRHELMVRRILILQQGVHSNNLKHVDHFHFHTFQNLCHRFCILNRSVSAKWQSFLLQYFLVTLGYASYSSISTFMCLWVDQNPDLYRPT